MCLHSLDCGESIHLDFLSKERGISNVPEQNAQTSDDRIKLHLRLVTLWRWQFVTFFHIHRHDYLQYIYLLPVDLPGASNFLAQNNFYGSSAELNCHD